MSVDFTSSDQGEMRFTELRLKGAFLIEAERLADQRGFFARTYCQRDFSDHGIVSRFVQCNISFNKHKGTLRGMHYQTEPFGEEKLIRCTMGAIYDVVVDIRPNSPTFKQWVANELTAENRLMVFAPRGFAHGFKTLCDNCEVFYHISELYRPDAAHGICWDDPDLGIEWPPGDPIISERDRSFPCISQGTR